MRKHDYIDVPVNDGDIDGIYRYLGWHMNKAGLSSTCFHYLEALKKMAEAGMAGANAKPERKTGRDTW